MSDPKLSPTDLWLKITEMPRPSVVVDFPRKGPDGKPVGEVRLRVLTQEEQMLCSAEAERYAKRAIKDMPKADDAKIGYENVYNNAAAVEVLFCAVRRVEDPEQGFFPTKDALRKFLSPDEVGVLMVHYYTAQAELGPIVAGLSEEELEAWITRLGEGGDRFPLDLLSWDDVKALAFSLACRMYASRTAKPSPGWQPEEPLPEASEPEQLTLPTA